MAASRSSGLASPFSLETRVNSASLSLHRNAILARFLLDQLAADFDGALALMNLSQCLIFCRARDDLANCSQSRLG